jgi:hypothetical protein
VAGGDQESGGGSGAGAGGLGHAFAPSVRLTTRPPTPSAEWAGLERLRVPIHGKGESGCGTQAALAALAE